MSLSVEELLKDRYKIIAPDTSGRWKVGDTYTFDREVAQTYSHWKNQDGTIISFDFFSAFPHLFKKLDWWEEREEKDMPEYVWYDNTGFAPKEILIVLKVKKWTLEPDGDMWASVEGDEIGFATDYMPRPATETEYLNYQKANTNG